MIFVDGHERLSLLFIDLLSLGCSRQRSPSHGFAAAIEAEHIRRVRREWLSDVESRSFLLDPAAAAGQ
jgi:hypothetical protein